MKKGFSLAEVLITLGIIGVVAAMTIPGLLSKYEEKATVSRVLKVYSVLDNAYKALLDEYGSPATWEGVKESNHNQDNAIAVAKMFARNIKLTNICDTRQSTCPMTTYDALTPGALLDSYKHIPGAKSYLNEATITFSVGSANCQGYGQYAWEKVTPSSPYYHACGSIYVDINGASLPNKYGRDLFVFMYTEDKLIPLGIPPTPYYGLSNSCNPKAKTSWDGATNGSYCGAWIIKNKNMDYLRRTVSW
ncbi:MAG: type II secretion system GspH family protein [Muribaculaceae bacterium]|nr:type II secretion system GspH family protein [Muribaculaceae bacterium]